MEKSTKLNTFFSRPVHPKTWSDYEFRHRIAAHHSKQNLEPIRDEVLHYTVGISSAGLEEAAQVLRQDPHSSQTVTANVRNVLPMGRRADRTSFALELEPNDELEREIAYYHEALQLKGVEHNIPHVTILRAYDISPQVQSDIESRIERYAPSQVTLGRLAVRMSLRSQHKAKTPHVQ